MAKFRIIEDLIEYSDGVGIKLIYNFLLNPNLHATINYRLANYISRVSILLPFCKILMYVNRVFFNVDIDYRADLAGGFVMKHGMGVVIGKNVKSLGKLTIYQQVTIGGDGRTRKLTDGNTIDQPIIEDNVTIYSHAVIVGPTIVGENSSVGAKTFIKKDIPKNTIVYENKNLVVRKL